MTTPQFAPLYQPFPWYYTGGRVISLDVRCHPERLAAMVPEPLVVSESGHAQIWCLEFPTIAGCGAYNEFLMLTSCSLDGEQGAFNVWIYVNNDAALSAGREITGIPKKLAQIDVHQKNDQRVATITRSGVEFARVGMTLDAEAPGSAVEEAQAGFSAPAWNFRHIPNPSDPDHPACSQITETRMSGRVHRVITGRGFVDFSPSASDPIWELYPEVVGASYIELDLVLPAPTIRYDYLHKT